MMTEDVNEMIANYNAGMTALKQTGVEIPVEAYRFGMLLERLKAAEDELKQFRDVTFGQQAYEAYCKQTDWKSLATGADLPQWISLSAAIREAWEVAAQAVGRSMISRLIKVRSEG